MKINNLNKLHNVSTIAKSAATHLENTEKIKCSKLNNNNRKLNKKET